MQTPLTNDLCSNIIIKAVSDNEPFDDVRIVTLQSVWIDMVQDWARKKNVSVSSLLKHIPPTTLQESVSIAPDQITVVLDTQAIDDTAVFNSMRLIYEALDTLQGKEGTVFLGQKRTMGANDFVNF